MNHFQFTLHLVLQWSIYQNVNNLLKVGLNSSPLLCLKNNFWIASLLSQCAKYVFVIFWNHVCKSKFRDLADPPPYLLCMMVRWRRGERLTLTCCHCSHLTTELSHTVATLHSANWPWHGDNASQSDGKY